MNRAHTLAFILLLSLTACKPAQETATPAADNKGGVPEKDVPAAPAKEAPVYSAITLVGYECGDNCYLVYQDGAGKEQRALCRAKNCDSWKRAQGLPKALVGKQVKARIGKGEQYDAAGNKMSSDFPSVEELVLP